MANLVERSLLYQVEQIGERPTGSVGNEQLNHYLQKRFSEMGYHVDSLDFDCVCWESDRSYLKTRHGETEIFPGPFSDSFEETCPAMFVETVEQLETVSIEGHILVLDGKISESPLMPKDFPFFYPEEHKRIIDAMESKNPRAIIAVTGKHPFCGLNPFPLYNDGSIGIPSGYTDQKTAEDFLYGEKEIYLNINSQKKPEQARQLIAATRKGKSRKIMVCAHMDSAYHSPAALDNAAGVSVLLETAHLLSGYAGPYELEFVPFNGEEYFGVGGQLAYLEQLGKEIENLALVINIDAPGYLKSNSALSFYNFNEMNLKQAQERIKASDYCEQGPEWIAGDHSIFVFRQIPTIAVTSSDLLNEVMGFTHTSGDNLEQVDPVLLQKTAEFLAEYIAQYE